MKATRPAVAALGAGTAGLVRKRLSVLDADLRQQADLRVRDLLLVQNSLYAEALERGRADAENVPDTLDAVMAIVRPIVECNRTQVDNGRVYLGEMVFGDPAEPHHREALTITGQTEEAVAAVLCRDTQVSEAHAATTARIVSAVMFLATAASVNVAASVDETVRDIREQIAALLTC